MKSATLENKTSVDLPVLLGVATALVMVPAILTFLLHGLLIKIFYRDRKRRLTVLIKNVSLYSRFALRVMRVRVETSGNLRPDNENVLFVCNHLSYLDMMVLAAYQPSVFVTSIDMGEVFFLGHMAEIGGSLFIERRHRDRVEADIEQMASVLRDGFDVTLFPEGTSGDGTTVLPFKKSLLLSAKRAGKRIQPLTLIYDQRDVCWYGDASFLPHFFRLMSKTSVTANVKLHMPIEVREKDCRDTLAKWTHQIIANSYNDRRAELGC